MRKLFLGMMALVMSVSVLTAGIPIVEAMPSSYNNLSNEEKKEFDKLYKETNTSKLQNVSVSYSSSISGKSDVNQYRWTTWRNDKKNAGINKKANNGNGNYSGFSKQKVQSWSRNDDYINAIKNLNNGKFPATKDYKYPTTTSGGKLDFWMGEPGFYSILGDPRYSNITLNGYRTFNWTEKIKKTKTEWKEKEEMDVKTYTKKSELLGLGYHSTNGKLQLYQAIKFKLDDFGISILDSQAKSMASSLQSSYDTKMINGKEIYEMHTNDSVSIKNGIAYIKISISGQTTDKVTPEIAVFQVTKKTKEKVTKTWYETKSHSKKQQIAQTVVAKNTYASQIQKYGTFYLTQKSNVSSNSIKQRNTGFWGSIVPSYHNSNPKTQDQGNYTWTFSTNVSSGKKAYNLYASITEKYKFIEDIADQITNIPNNGLPNPPENPDDPLPTIPGGGDSSTGGNKPGGGSGTDTGNPDGGGTDPSNPGGGDGTDPTDPNNPGGNGGGNNGSSNPTNPDNPDKIGEKENPPMINIEVDVDDGISTKRLPTMVHLYDLYRR